MDARTLNLKTIFGQDRRHLVPLFQRPYVWNRDVQWEPLWEDIRNVAERIYSRQAEVRPHFLGAVVFDQVMKPTGHIETRLIIDGQQRLTTMQIILESLSDLCRDLKADKHHKALLKLTRNDDPMSEDEDDQFKVWPTNVDQEHFRKVMLAKNPKALFAAYGVKNADDTVGHAIADAYVFFFESMKEWLNVKMSKQEDRIEALFNTLRDYLRLVVIDLESDDDAQLIFETLNARGTPLLPSDLVKNFLFHQATSRGENVEKLYQKYWRDFDLDHEYWRKEIGRGHAQRARIDVYLQHFLTLKTLDEVPVGHLYGGFRRYVLNDVMNGPQDHLSDLKQFAKTYQQFSNRDEKNPFADFFHRLELLDMTTAFPFLLQLFVVYSDETAILMEITKEIESFLVRRTVVQLNTRGYNRLFLDLLKTLDGRKEGLRRRVRGILLSSNADSNRWPNDAEFKQAWLQTPVYSVLVRNRVRLILEALECQMRTDLTEKVKLADTLTIEHIMPQEWRKHWPLADPTDEAEAERETAIHTLGNLTLLTGKLNPTVSNGPWAEKRKAVTKHSALALNRALNDFEDWNEGVIHRRSKELFKLALRIWPFPKN